jgi:hypothetical protein
MEIVVVVIPDSIAHFKGAGKLVIDWVDNNASTRS